MTPSVLVIELVTSLEMATNVLFPKAIPLHSAVTGGVRSVHVIPSGLVIIELGVEPKELETATKRPLPKVIAFHWALEVGG